MISWQLFSKTQNHTCELVRITAEKLIKWSQLHRPWIIFFLSSVRRMQLVILIDMKIEIHIFIPTLIKTLSCADYMTIFYLFFMWNNLRWSNYIFEMLHEWRNKPEIARFRIHSVRKTFVQVKTSNSYLPKTIFFSPIATLKVHVPKLPIQSIMTFL